MANAKFEHDLIVAVGEQHYVVGRTLGQLSERFGVNYAMLSEALRRVGKMLEPSLERLKTDYRKAEIRHVDETSWRTDGESGCSWYFGSADVSLHLFRIT